jgi:serine/threonine-protein kinase
MNATPVKARDIFLAAVKLSPDAWPDYLAEACGGDEELRRRVTNLLQAHQEAGSFLAPDAPPPVATVDEPIGERLGTVVGPYKLMEQIGEGGMGLVFVAEQQHPVRRKVAFKVIKPGMDTRQVVGRFEAERQALALMEHPNIARVLDGGETANGAPYFVMELVKGVPITEFCDQNQVTIRERLELFLSVCSAVQHAHQKGIIHRDIKPSNVLVMSQDGTSVVKVIDFGIAKAIGQQLTDKTIYTQFAQMVGTPLYMSPEQAGESGLDVDTRSDIYSLGVLLYELLTGTTPFTPERLRQAGFDEMRRIIREEEPPRPSTRISTLGQAAATVSAQRKSDPRRLSQVIRGELDWIVMKALEKDRNRRYETATGFAMDVQRYLADEPVLACPPSAAYRLRKFARRNRLGLAAAASILVFILSLGAVIGWALRDRDAREREAASEKKAHKAALDDEVKRNLDDAEALIDQEKWPEALAAGHRTRDLLAAEGRRETPLRLQELERDLAIVRSLEDIYARLKGEAFFTGHEQDAAYAKVFADCGIDVATLPVAEAAERIRTRRIRHELVRGLEFWSLARRYANSQAPPDWKQLLEIAKAADQDVWRNQVRDALKAEDRRALQALAASADVRRLPPQTLVLLGRTLNELGGQEQAVALLREAHRQYPGDLWVNDSLGVVCLWSQPPQYDDAVRFYTATVALRPNNPYMVHQLGDALRKKGSIAESIAAFSKAIEQRPDYCEAWYHRGEAYVKAGQVDKGLADYSKAIEVDSKNSVAWNERGVAYIGLHHYENALSDLNKAIELNPNNTSAWNNRGAAHLGLHQYDKALADLNKALELNRNNADAWNNRGAAHLGLHQYDKALSDVNKAIELAPGNALHWGNRAAVHVHLHQYNEALADCNKAIELDPRNPAGWINRGKTYPWLRQFDKAIADLTKAIELDPKNSMPWTSRGSAYQELKQFDKAIADLTKAIDLDPNKSTAWSNRGKFYLEVHQYDKALAEISKAIQLDPKNAEAFAIRGTIYLALGQLDKALVDLNKAIELNHSVTFAWTNRAAAYAGLHQYERAFSDLNKAIEVDPNDALVWFGRGSLYSKLGKFDKATADFSKAIELDPRTSVLWNARGNAYNGLRQYEKALADFSKAIELDPKMAVAWANRGSAYSELHQYKKAIADYSKAIDLNPNIVAWWHNRGTAHVRSKQWDQAIANFSKAIELNPKISVIWSERGKAYCGLRQYEKALADFSKATELDPKTAGAWLNRGSAYDQLRQYEKAIADYSRAIEFNPKDVSAWANRGAARFRLKQWDQAFADTSRALELQPDLPVLQNNLAWHLSTHPEPTRRDPRRAVELAEKAVKAEPQQGVFRKTLGVARYRAGDASGAIAPLQEALKRFEGVTDFQPGAGRSLFFLAMAQHKAGHGPEARQAYNRALAWLKTNQQALKKNAWAADDLRRWRAEAEEVLGIQKRK